MKKHILLLNARRRVFMINSMNEYLSKNIKNYEMATSDTDRLDPIAYSTKILNILTKLRLKLKSLAVKLLSQKKRNLKSVLIKEKLINS